MKIPIKNIYYMLCYAWQHLESIKRGPVDSLAGDHLVDLFARILSECVKDLAANGLFRDYVESTEEAFGVKGKLLVSPTLQKSLLNVGRSVCATDEYSINNRPNQVILATIEALLSVHNLNPSLRQQLQERSEILSGVDRIRVSSRDIMSIRISRMNRHYAHVLRVCSLIWEQLMPDESSGKYIFEEFDRDEVKMRRVFEDFVRNFFKIEGRRYDHVKSEVIGWQYLPNVAGDQNLLPIMKTDTSLISLLDYTVIETKFVPEALQERVPGAEKLRSSHLYQIMAYLENIRRKTQKTPRGILLYPQVDRRIAEIYRIWGFELHIRTIDLTQDWVDIRRDLLDLVPTESAA